MVLVLVHLCAPSKVSFNGITIKILGEFTPRC
jgi:hypothetical protein